MSKSSTISHAAVLLLLLVQPVLAGQTPPNPAKDPSGPITAIEVLDASSFRIKSSTFKDQPTTAIYRLYGVSACGTGTAADCQIKAKALLASLAQGNTIVCNPIGSKGPEILSVCSIQTIKSQADCTALGVKDINECLMKGMKDFGAELVKTGLATVSPDIDPTQAAKYKELEAAAKPKTP